MGDFRTPRRASDERLVQLAAAADALAREATGEAARALDLVASGERVLIAVSSRGDRQLVLLERESTDGTLSVRQSQVIARLCRGYSLKQVAAELGIALSTASRHVQQATRRLGYRTHFSVATALAPWAQLAAHAGPLGFAPRGTKSGSSAPRVSVFASDGRTFEVVGFSRPDVERDRSLTPAEVEVAELVRRGLSNDAIASARRRSPRTIANQLAGLYLKLGVHSRMELTLATA